MDHSDSKDADNSETPATRPSAIERQMAAVSRLGYDTQAHQEAPERAIGEREAYFYARRRPRYRSGWVSFLAVFLLVVIGLALVFTELGSSLQNMVGAALQPAQPPAAAPRPPPAIIPPVAAPKPAPPVAAPAEVATAPAALAVPIAAVSLRDRPELLEQLVQVYRSRLAADPGDAAARVALNQLQERSLAELSTIMVANDEPATARSLEIVSRLFPELAENPRYQYLLVRRDRIQREAKPEPAAEPQQATPAATAVSPATTPPVKSVVSSKPHIRVVSITPGTMIEQRFVPSAEGTAFMVEISYRNFKNLDDQSEPALVALLGMPGSPTVFAEAPIDIDGDRGTKSFLMQTLIPGVAGERYRLNFMLNGEFLASSTVRLAAPRQ